MEFIISEMNKPLTIAHVFGALVGIALAGLLLIAIDYVIYTLRISWLFNKLRCSLGIHTRLKVWTGGYVCTFCGFNSETEELK